MSYQTVTASIDGSVGVITLNRPEVLNALNVQLMSELVDALQEYDRNPEVRCIALVGSDKAFAAGADIPEMADAGPIELLFGNRFERWDSIRQISTPIVAGVSGFCLGGGCELVMSCDVVIASETAQFGQPEINLGIMPGAGGTQRLTRAVGKALAMDLILSGRFLNAEEAVSYGLASRVVSAEGWLDETMKVAHTIAAKSPVALRLAKDAVLAAFDTTLQAGIAYERRAFYLLFASEDQSEGMHAFMEKRSPDFVGR